MKRVVRVNASFTISDLEKTSHSPANTPGVLTDPALFRFRIANDFHTVAANVITAPVMIYTTGIIIEIIEHLKNGTTRPNCAKVVFTVSHESQSVRICDFHRSQIPI